MSNVKYLFLITVIIVVYHFRKKRFHFISLLLHFVNLESVKLPTAEHAKAADQYGRRGKSTMCASVFKCPFQLKVLLLVWLLLNSKFVFVFYFYMFQSFPFFSFLMQYQVHFFLLISNRYVCLLVSSVKRHSLCLTLHYCCLLTYNPAQPGTLNNPGCDVRKRCRKKEGTCLKFNREILYSLHSCKISSCLRNYLNCIVLHLII